MNGTRKKFPLCRRQIFIKIDLKKEKRKKVFFPRKLGKIMILLKKVSLIMLNSIIHDRRAVTQKRRVQPPPATKKVGDPADH